MPEIKLEKRTILHCQQGTSDKVYIVDFLSKQLDDGNYLLVVKSYYGKRKDPYLTSKISYSGRFSADDYIYYEEYGLGDRLVAEKIRKGYVDVTKKSSVTKTIAGLENLSLTDGVAQAEKMAGNHISKGGLRDLDV